jgi:hypothetical protein
LKGGDLYDNCTMKLFFFVALLELVDTSCGIHQHLLTCEERMRSIGDFKLHQGIFVAIIPLDCFSCGSSRTAEECFSITHILENNEPVAFWMQILFHNSLIVCTDFAVRFFNWMAKLGIFFKFLKKNVSIAHVNVLQWNTQVGILAKLDHRLQVVYFLAGHPYEVVHDLRLHLHATVLYELNDLFGIFLL